MNIPKETREKMILGELAGATTKVDDKIYFKVTDVQINLGNKAKITLFYKNTILATEDLSRIGAGDTIDIHLEDPLLYVITTA